MSHASLVFISIGMLFFAAYMIWFDIRLEHSLKIRKAMMEYFANPEASDPTNENSYVIVTVHNDDGYEASIDMADEGSKPTFPDIPHER